MKNSMDNLKKRPFDSLIFRAAMGRNMAIVGAALLGGAACILLLAAMVGVIGMIAGELSVLHVLALLGMAGGFAMLSALCLAVTEGYGIAWHQAEDGHDSCD